MERREFEDSLKKAFEEAEVAPSENVWRHVELELEKEKSTGLKKRLAFYQMLAAASVIFALAFSIGIYSVNNDRMNENAVSRVSEPSATDDTAPERKAMADATDVVKAEKAPIPARSDDRAQTVSSGDAGTQSSKVVLATADQQEEIVPADLIAVLSRQPLPRLVDPRALVPHLERTSAQPDPVAQMLAALDQREKEIRGEEKEDEKKNAREDLWSSVGFAAGSFTSTNAGVSAAPLNSAIAMSSPLANEEARASGLSYSMGVNMGTRISDRWVLQGGLNYLSQSSDFTAHNAIRTSDFSTFKPASIGQLDKLPESDYSNEKLVATAPYNVNNNIRYLTIPMQAGYLLVDKKLALQVSAGVATDLFLQNIVSAEGDNLDRTSEALGEDTPYRQVNFSGLAGTELSYKLGRNYRISLNPGIRYPLSSIYRSDLDVKASPLTFDLGLRFRYIFH